MHFSNIMSSKIISRRRMCEYSIYTCGSLLLQGGIMKNNVISLQRRSIPSSGEKIPVVGLGTWRTFDAGNDKHKRETLKQVLLTWLVITHQWLTPLLCMALQNQWQVIFQRNLRYDLLLYSSLPRCGLPANNRVLNK